MIFISINSFTISIIHYYNNQMKQGNKNSTQVVRPPVKTKTNNKNKSKV